MGHSRIGRLPTSRKWREVVSFVVSGASVETIARQTSLAAESALTAAASDPAPAHVFWLLTQIPVAAGGDNFERKLRSLGIYVDSAPTLPEICSALMEANDRQMQSARGRTDLGELAQLSAVESLSAVAGREISDLFGPMHEPENTKRALRRLANPKRFAVLARDFFARLTRRHINYYLSRELPNHIGVGRRFASLSDYNGFEDALEAHCRESARIVEEFSADWFSKQTYEGGIDPRKAGNFLQYAFEKVRGELERRRDGDS